MKLTMHHNSVSSSLLKDPKKQLKFNIFFTWFWFWNMLVVAEVYLFQQPFYTAHQPTFVFYLIMVSLWANFATHFGSISGSEAAIQTNNLEINKVEKLEVTV